MSIGVGQDSIFVKINSRTEFCICEVLCPVFGIGQSFVLVRVRVYNWWLYNNLKVDLFKTIHTLNKNSGFPAFCICENKDADQLRGDREADQRLCFRYTDSTIPLLPKFEISSL